MTGSNTIQHDRLPSSKPPDAVSKSARHAPGLLLILAFLAFVPLAWMAWSHAVDVPGYDQINWNIVDLIEASQNGRLTWTVFFLSHNEHQLLFTKLMFMLNAAGFNWYRPLDSLICAGAIAAAAFLLARWAHRRRGTWAALSTVLIVASIDQWRNVTWGFMLQHGMALLFAVLLALYSDRVRLHAVWLTMLALLGTAASGNGLVLWVVGGLLLGLQARRSKASGDWLQLLLFTAMAVATVLGYLSSVEGPDAPLLDPFGFLHSLITVLANPLGYLVRSGTARAIVGTAVLLATLLLVLQWLRAEIRGQMVDALALRPLAVLAMFALGSAVLVSLKRDSGMLLDVKYNTSINPLYAVLSLAAWDGWRGGGSASGRLASIAITLFMSVSALLSLNAAALTERHDRANAVADYVQAMAGRDGMINSAASDWRGPVRPDGGTQMERLDRLHMLRPALAQFQVALLRELHQPATLVAARAGLEVDIRSKPDMPVLDVVGSPGVDTRGHAPDAILVIARPAAGGLTSVSVELVAKSRRRDHRGYPWETNSLGFLSDRYSVPSETHAIETLSLVAVWLDTLQMKTLASFGRQDLYGSGS